MLTLAEANQAIAGALAKAESMKTKIAVSVYCLGNEGCEQSDSVRRSEVWGSTFAGLSFHADLRGVYAEPGREVLRHGWEMRGQLRCVENDHRVNVENAKTIGSE